MEWETLLQQLIDLVEQTAPKLWVIAVKQVYVQAAQSGIFLLVSLIAIPALWKASKAAYLEKIQRYSDTVEMKRFFFPLGVVMAIVIAVVSTFFLAGYLINPEYYAIELLMNYVK